MDVLALQQAKADAAKRYLTPTGATSGGVSAQLRRREIPGPAALPVPMPVQPLVAAVSTSSGLTGATLWSPWEPGAFVRGPTKMIPGAAFPDNQGLIADSTMFTQGASLPPITVETVLESFDPLGRFEIKTKANTQTVRISVLVNGQWQYITGPIPTGVAVAASGSGSSFGAATVYWQVTGINGAGGESSPCAPVSAALTAGQNGVVTWAAQAAATGGYNIYRSVNPQGPYRLAGTVSSGTLTFTDTGAAIASTAQLPPADGGATFITTGSGSTSFVLVTLGAPGRYTLRLEAPNTYRDFGINLPNAVDTLRAPRAMYGQASTSRRKIALLTDSFGQPTIPDKGQFGAYQGYPSVLAHLLGATVIPVAQGGGGYTQAGTGSPATNFQAMVADLIAQAPDEAWLCAGLNDRANTVTAGNANAVQTAVAAVIASIKAALPNCVIVAFGPWTVGNAQKYQQGLLAVRDAIQAAAAAAGVKFLDTLASPALPIVASGVPAASTLAAQGTAAATTISSNASYPVGTYVQIGGGVGDINTEIRKITAVSGTGPYTLTFSGAYPLAWTHASGTTLTAVGQGFLTGTGHQTVETNDGVADKAIGSDGTHPSVLGHRNLAQFLFDQRYSQLAP